MWDGNGMTGFGWAMMSVSMLLFWALLISALVILVRALERRGDAGGAPQGPAGGTGAAERILAERFARGEIDQEEYERRLRVLRSSSAPDTHG